MVAHLFGNCGSDILVHIKGKAKKHDLMFAQQVHLSKTGSRMAIATGLLLCAYIFIAAGVLSDYFILDATIATGLLLSPFILIVKKGNFSQLYLVAAIIFLMILFFIPIKTTLFLALMAAMLFLTESSIGKINNAFFFLLILLSPLFNYFSNMISFPIRLWLSEVAGTLLNRLLKHVSVAGNIILVNGSEFSVDTVCAGLKMLLTSFIIALVIIVFYQRKMKKRVSSFVIFLLLLLTFLLNIICNLFRILLLVIFRVMPENGLHDIIGIVCLVVYVVLPLLFIFKYVISRLQDAIPITTGKTPGPAVVIINMVLVLFICYTASRIESEPVRFMNGKKYVLEGYDRTLLSTGVQKFENKEALIYIKPLCFYSAEHNPMICWRGSGYEFKRINKETLKGQEIYTGLLEKGKDKIYTAWWFDNGACKTIEHTVWRWKSMKGEGAFVLINISAATEKGLKKKSEELLTSTLKEE
jgi:exosortase N